MNLQTKVNKAFKAEAVNERESIDGATILYYFRNNRRRAVIAILTGFNFTFFKYHNDRAQYRNQDNKLVSYVWRDKVNCFYDG